MKISDFTKFKNLDTYTPSYITKEEAIISLSKSYLKFA